MAIFGVGVGFDNSFGTTHVLEQLSFLPSSAPVPAPAWAEMVLFPDITGRPAIRNSTFLPEFSFDFNSKVARLNG